MNQIFEEVFGYDESEIQGESLDDYVVPPDKQAEATELNDRVLDGEAFSVEVTRETADGTKEFLIQNTVHPEMPGEFAMYTDISERKQRERELYRQNERLERFASVVSHDLRNPLNVATTRLELAQAECESDHLDDVAQAHDRIDTLIDDILTLARGGEQVREPETVDIADTIDSCWRNVGTAEATLVTETEQTIDAEPSRLKQLLENLFRTAAEHAGDDVTVTVGELDNRDGFYVADDGPGIPADKRDEVFEAGYSTHEIFVEYPVDNGIPNS